MSTSRQLKIIYVIRPSTYQINIQCFCKIMFKYGKIVINDKPTLGSEPGSPDFFEQNNGIPFKSHIKIPVSA